MRSLLRFAHGIDHISDFLGRIGILLVLPLIAVGAYNVVARYLGRFVGQNLSSNVFIEIQWYVYAILFFLMFAYNLRHDVNVRVDILYTDWSIKRRTWIDLLGTILILIPFAVLGIWMTVNPVLLSWGRLPDGSFGAWEMSPDPGGLPRAPIKTFILLAFGALLLQGIAQAIKYAAVLLGHREVAQELVAEVTPQETD